MLNEAMQADKTADRRAPVAQALERLGEIMAQADGLTDRLAKKLDPVVFHTPRPEGVDDTAGHRPAGSDLTQRLHSLGDSLAETVARLARLHDGIEL